MTRWELKKYVPVGYAIKTWAGSAIIGSSFWMFYMIYQNGIDYAHVIFLFFSWLIGVFMSLLLSCPILILYVGILSILARIVPNQFQFKSILTFISIVVWVIATYVLSRLDQYSRSFNEGTLLFIPYLVGLVIFIWMNDMVLLKKEGSNFEEEDVLDVEI